MTRFRSPSSLRTAGTDQAPPARASETALHRRALLARAGALLVGGCLAGLPAEGRAVVPPRFLREWGRRGQAEGEFDSPIAIAVDSKDRIYVTDFKNLRVQKFTADGEFLTALPVAAPQPGGLAVDREGCVYVAHWNQHKIVVYSPTGQVLREWGKMGTGDGEFRLPGGLAIARDASVYVPDQGNSRIQKFAPDGRFLLKWGEHGAGSGQFGEGRVPGSRFAGPQFLALDRDGNVYATEVTSTRVQKFTAEGKHLLTFGSGRTPRAGLAAASRSAGRSGCAWTGARTSGSARRTITSRSGTPRGVSSNASERTAPLPATSITRTVWRSTAATASTWWMRRTTGSRSSRWSEALQRGWRGDSGDQIDENR